MECCGKAAALAGRIRPATLAVRLACHAENLGSGRSRYESCGYAAALHSCGFAAALHGTPFASNAAHTIATSNTRKMKPHRGEVVALGNVG